MQIIFCHHNGMRLEIITEGILGNSQNVKINKTLLYN